MDTIIKVEPDEDSKPFGECSNVALPDIKMNTTSQEFDTNAVLGRIKEELDLSVNDMAEIFPDHIKPSSIPSKRARWQHDSKEPVDNSVPFRDAPGDRLSQFKSEEMFNGDDPSSVVGSFKEEPEATVPSWAAAGPFTASPPCASVETAVEQPHDFIPTLEQNRILSEGKIVFLMEMAGDISEEDFSGYSSSDEEYTIAHVRRLKDTEQNHNGPGTSSNVARLPIEMISRDVEELEEEDDEEEVEELAAWEGQGTGNKHKLACAGVHWRFQDLQPFDVSYNESFSEPPDEQTPIKYFKQFCTSQVFINFTEQTNLFSFEKTGKSLETNEHEMQEYIGIHIMSGIVRLPSYKQYWAEETRYPPIADVMSRNRFYQIRNHFHVNDNSKMVHRENSDHDRLFKVRPFVDEVRRNMHKVDLEENLTVDKFLIPFKGKHIVKQYVGSNPHKRGIKVFALAGASGMMYDFEIYLGKTDIFAESDFGIGGDVVLRLTKRLPADHNFKVFVDQCFASYALAVALKQRGILMAGNVGKKCVPCNSFKGNAELKKEERGSFDYRTDVQNNITVVRWLNKKFTTFISSFIGVQPVTKVHCWSVADNSRIEVPRPAMVQAYDESMGGVELHDMLVTCHRINFKTKRYYLRIVFHLIDVCMVNAWLLYRRHLKQKGDTKYMTLTKFRTQVAVGLMSSGVRHTARKGGVPPEESREVKRKCFVPRPIDDVRYDGVRHWPDTTNTRQRCKMCVIAYSRMKCDKCGVFLCLNKNNNCFRKFHTK